MFMIIPASRNDTIKEEIPDETRARVKKACNRCRIKKSKCDGRIPCARCERDKIACRADRGPLDHKELSRSYIASLEQQQISLLNALRELNRRFPNESKVRSILEQLEASGFDVGPLEPRNELFWDGAACRPSNPNETVEQAPNHSAGLDVDNTSVFDLGPLLAHPEPLDSQTVADFLWNTSGTAMQQDIPNGLYQDVFLTEPVTDTDAFMLSVTNINQQPDNFQNSGTGLIESRGLS